MTLGHGGLSSYQSCLSLRSLSDKMGIIKAWLHVLVTAMKSADVPKASLRGSGTYPAASSSWETSSMLSN